jgi:hypothetical protein
MVVWITDEFGVDPVQRAYMESVATPETAMMLAVYDLGGFPVRSEVQMGPIQMWSQLASIEHRPAPAGTYAVPPGYSGCQMRNGGQVTSAPWLDAYKHSSVVAAATRQWLPPLGRGARLVRGLLKLRTMYSMMSPVAALHQTG